MKKLVRFSFFLISTAASAQQVESTFIEEKPNGVRVYQQVGVVSPSQTYSEAKLPSDISRVPKTLNEFTYDECVNAIKDVTGKILHLIESEGNDEEIQAKREELERIKRFMETLTPN
jgi:hypothetical protein